MRALTFAVLVGVSTALPAHAAAPGLTKLVARCDQATNHNACGNIARPVWQRFEAGNGEVTKVDVSTVRRTRQGGVIVTSYTAVPFTRFDMHRLRGLYFNCQGQYSDMSALGQTIDAPPRSVAGQVAATFCSAGRANSVIRAWGVANDECQGGNVAFNSPVCRRRNQLQSQAERLGWCWSYSDWRVSRADYRWHRCDIAHPVGFKPDPALD